MNSLGYTNTTLPIYMTVGVIPTSYEFRANQWATITINGRIAVEFCTPEQSCGEDWFLCADQLNVFDFLNSSVGGQLHIEVTVTGVESGPCDYEGFPLFASLRLSETYVPVSTVEARLSVMTIVVPVVLVLLFLLGVFLLDKIVAYRKANDKYRVRQAVDVEKGLENKDPDELAARGGGKAPPLQSLPLHKLHRQWTVANSRHLSKVFPVEEDSEGDVIEGGEEEEEEEDHDHTSSSSCT